MGYASFCAVNSLYAELSVLPWPDLKLVIKFLMYTWRSRQSRLLGSPIALSIL